MAKQKVVSSDDVQPYRLTEPEPLAPKPAPLDLTAAPETKTNAKSYWRRLPWQETVLFLVSTGLDLTMTLNLLDRGGFSEGNPFARWFLHTYGPRGLVYFKFAMAALVVIIAHFVEFHRKKLGRWILNVGTVVVALVVIYSFILLLRHVPPDQIFRRLQAVE